jgi:hypothetical protein
MTSRSGLGSRPLPRETSQVFVLFAFAPVFFAFEIWQLVIAERYLGLKQIARGIDPRELGLGELTAACWSLALLAYWAWMVIMLFQPMGRFQFLILLAVSGLGFALRRGSGLKWILVILTFEGSIRIGMLLSLGALVWHHL